MIFAKKAKMWYNDSNLRGIEITSCHNNQLVENYEKRQFSESLPKFEDTFEPSKYRIEEIKRLDLEESSYQEEQTDTTSFSK